MLELFWLVGLFESFESFVLFELFRVVELCLFELCLFESRLFELCLLESFEPFGVCVFNLCVGVGRASCFVCAWVSCFGFAFARFAADLAADMSESARCAPEAAKRPDVRGGSCWWVAPWLGGLVCGIMYDCGSFRVVMSEVGL